MTLRSLSYTGGKSPLSPRRTGKWIASLLPPADLYAEPFFGMGGVLLARPKAVVEIVNDLDDRVYNWWTVVRDSPCELQRLIALTPKARRTHEWAMAAMDDPAESPIRRALAFTFVCQTALATQGSFALSYDSGRERGWRANLDASLVALAERMRNVQLEHGDACALLERLAIEEGGVVYCDPPYADTVGYNGAYRHVDDRERLTAALLAQRSACAVSGYGTEWDHLGWERHEYRTYVSVGASATSSPRTEVLWTSFPATRQEAML